MPGVGIIFDPGVIHIVPVTLAEEIISFNAFPQEIAFTVELNYECPVPSEGILYEYWFSGHLHSATRDST